MITLPPIKSTCVGIAVALFTSTASFAAAIQIDDVCIDIGVAEVSDFWNALGFDHNWSFVVTQKGIPKPQQEVRSFHIRGFPGDGSSDDDYDDLAVRPKPHGLHWKKARTTTQIGWQHILNRPNLLSVAGESITFKMDSEFGLAEMVAGGKFQVGIDYNSGELKWMDGFVDEDDILPLQFGRINPDPFGFVPHFRPIPLPASAPMLLVGLGVLGFAGRKLSPTGRGKAPASA